MNFSALFQAIALTAALKLRRVLKRRSKMIGAWEADGILWINNALVYKARPESVAEVFTVGSPINSTFYFDIPRSLYGELAHSRTVCEM